METLGRLIGNARVKASYTQEKLAEKMEKTKQWMGAIENGSALPPLELLLQLHQELVPKDDTDPNSELKVWLLRWLESRVEQRSNVNIEPALMVIRQLYGPSKHVRKTRVPSSTLPTLEDFPEAFENLVIVCGDRRESPPKTKADLFVDSFSSADLISLKTLFDETGPLEIISDKIFALGDPDYLKREYGRKNLIVVGSPAINLLSRTINKHSVFRFSIPKAARDFVKYLDKEIPEINDPHLRKIFWEMASKWKEPPDYAAIDTDYYYEEYKKKEFRIHRDQIVDLAKKVREVLTDHTAKEMKHFFRKAGFVDPVDTRLQGYFTRHDNDFGVISLCPHPYPDDGNYLCILVAGIHAPGTDMAMRVLATNEFKDHPLGGVIEVKLDLEAGWMERFHSANFDWQTRSYTIDNILTNLRRPKAHTIFDKCEPGDIKNLIDFIRRFTEI